MADAPPADLAAGPGDTVIELRGGVPYIYTQPVAGGFLDVTDLLTTAGAGFVEKEHPRDPHSGKWIRDPAGKFLDAAANDLKFQQRVSHNGHVIDRTKAGFTVKLKSGEKQHYDKTEHAAEAARRGRHLSAAEMNRAKTEPRKPEPPQSLHEERPQNLRDLEVQWRMARSRMNSARGPGQAQSARRLMLEKEAALKALGAELSGRGAGESWKIRKPPKPEPHRPPEPAGDAYHRQLFDNLSRSLGSTDLSARQVRDLQREQALPGSSLRALSDAELKGLGDQASKRTYTDRHAGVIEGLVNEERSRRNNAKPGAGGGALGWSSAGANYHYGKDSGGQITYTLHYAPGGGWDVFEGHRPAVTKGDKPLHHAGNAKDAKAWADAHSAGTLKPEAPKLPAVDPGRTLSAKPPAPGKRSPLEAHLQEEYLSSGGKHGGFSVVDREEPNTVKNLELYGRMPREIRKQLALQGVEFYIGTRPVTELDDLKKWANEQPSGYAKGNTFDKVAAMVTRRTVDGKPQTITALGGGHRTYGADSVNVSAHEAAHALDFSSGGISDEHEFLVLQKRAKAAFGEAINPYYVQAGNPRQGTKEFLAETYAAWVEYRTDAARGLKVMSSVARHDDRYHAEFLAIGKDLAAFYDRLFAKVQQKQGGHDHGAGH